MNAAATKLGQPGTSTAVSGNDVVNLFSHFGPIPGNAAQYRELIREEAALHAAQRWPLLAEIQGIDSEDGKSV